MNVLGLLLALVFFAAIFFIVYYIYTYFFRSKPGKKTIEKDVDSIRNDMKDWINKLVPWSREEMELLSLNRSEEFVSKRPSKLRKGLLYSIYNEPLVAYAVKDYPGNSYRLIYARLSNREYIYRITPKGTEIYMNNKAFAKIQKSGEMIDSKGKKVIARLHADSDSHMPIIIDQEEIGQLVDKSKTDRVNPRAFEFLHEMDEHQEAKFMALSLQNILKDKKTK